MKFTKIVNPGEMIPPWHGIARRYYLEQRTITAVIPLNWVIAIWDGVYAYLKFGTRAISDEPRVAYLQGRRDQANGR
jgi:hypothetical protein